MDLVLASLMDNKSMTNTKDCCPPKSQWSQCRPWELTEQTSVTCYADSLSAESLNIAGAQVNVYKLLGVHEQTKLVDLVGDGSPISGGFLSNYPPINAFSSNSNEWKSSQSGKVSIMDRSFIGYDFGVQKLPNGRQRYGTGGDIRKHITSIKIKQSSNPLNRVTKARVERSEDGINWYGVALINLPNDDALNLIHFKHSVPNRYWRFRPLDFPGLDCDSWGIQALELLDYSATNIDNIQDKILMENRDRQYSKEPITLKGYYDFQSPNTDLSQFGMVITPYYSIKINFTSCVLNIGRPIVIGDILELPSETQYTPQLTPVKRWLEVTDVTWDPQSFTPGWRPTLLLIRAEPAMASQETQDLFGDLAQVVDSSGLFSTDDGSNLVYQDISNITQTIKETAASQVPLKGSEGSNVVRDFAEQEIAQSVSQGVHPSVLPALNLNSNGLYIEDAIPPNGAVYTEGTSFPPSPKPNAYHRLTYVGLAGDIPTKLYRWSTIKARWIYLETDKRKQFDGQKPQLAEYTTSSHKKWANKVR